MVQICEQCGMNLYDTQYEPFLLNSEEALCYFCAQPIQYKINKLQNLRTKSEFDLEKKEILSICNTYYDKAVTDSINALIDKIYANTTIPQTEQMLVKKKCIQNHILTSGFNFEGYSITKYVGIVSGQVVLGTGFLSELTASFADFFGEESNKFADKLETAKNAAVEKLIIKSVDKGGNAVIGVDFDYVTFHGNMIGVIANGTSVIIEEIKEKTD